MLDFITDDCDELMGVVGFEDLPLNISPETLLQTKNFDAQIKMLDISNEIKIGYSTTTGRLSLAASPSASSRI